jgi:predicted amidohydrolase YtcJ
MVAYTRGSAFATRSEHERGSIEAGKLADLVVLGEDPRLVRPEDIGEVPVIATIVGGVVAYRAG